MSSKVFDPEDERHVSRLVWRQVHVASAKPVEELQADFRAQISRLEQLYEKRIREAHAAGLREGETSGRSSAAANLQPVLDRLAQTIDELSNLRHRLRRDAEEDMVKLSLAIARRVLRRELAIDPEALHGLILGALEKLQGQEVSRVKVHPAHAEAIAAYLRNSPANPVVQVIPDSTSEPGAAIFETVRGNLDASVESQLQEIERGLADQLKRRS